MPPLKILITGIAGFVGYHLAQHLVSQTKMDIVGIDHLNDYYPVELKRARLFQLGLRTSEFRPENLYGNRLRFMEMDICDSEGLDRLFSEEKFDIVCNLAAYTDVRDSIYNPIPFIKSNIQGFTELILQCQKHDVKHLLYASTSSVYSPSNAYPITENGLTEYPHNTYAATKKSNELIAHVYSNLFGLTVTGMRFFTVFGPWGRPDMATYRFTKAIIDNELVNLFNNGDHIRDFTYVTDTVARVARLIAQPLDGLAEKYRSSQTDKTDAPYRIYNISSNRPIALKQLVVSLEKAIGKKAIIQNLDRQLGDVYKTHSNTSLFDLEFGERPLVPFDEGIKNFVEWYKMYQALKK